MANKLFFLFLLLLSQIMYSQGFEGIVTYEVSLQIVGEESDSLKIESSKMFKSTQMDFYKGNHYKSVSRDPFQDTQSISQFDPNTNLTYGYIKDDYRQAFWYDASKHVPKDYHVTPVPDETILGYKCKGLKFKSKEIEVIYWFADSYKIDTTRYQNNMGYFFSEFIRLTGNLPLKYSIKVGHEQFNVIIATNIKERSLEEKLFELPKFEKLIESTN